LAPAADPEERANLTRNVDASLEAVEEILGALLDISRSTRRDKAGDRDLRIQDLFRQLDIEFGPLADPRAWR